MTGNAATIAAYLKGKGLTDAQVAGILGNWKVESNFSPTATGDGGLAYGLAQWHPDRRPANLGSDVQSQLNWFWTEAHSSESSAFNKFLANSSTPGEAAASFDQFYERSDGTARPLRIEDADAYYPEVSGVTQQAGLIDTPGGVVSVIKNAAGIGSGVVNATKDVGSFLAWFGDKNHLLRLGYFVIGAALVLVGGAKLVGTSVPGPLGKVM